VNVATGGSDCVSADGHSCCVLSWNPLHRPVIRQHASSIKADRRSSARALHRPVGLPPVESQQNRPHRWPINFYGYRYLDPLTGRWMSKDPLGERGGLNLYGFVGNDGVDMGDILGMTPPTGVKDSGNGTWTARKKIRNNCTGTEQINDKVKLFYYSVGVNETGHLASAQRMNKSNFGGTGLRVGSMAELLDSIEASIGCCKCVEELHILSHGSQANGVYLKSKTVNAVDNIGGGVNGQKLGSILKDAMCPGARILLYGCGTADGDSDLNPTLPQLFHSFGKELSDKSNASVTGTPDGTVLGIDADGHVTLKDTKSGEDAERLWFFEPGHDPIQIPLPPSSKPW